MPKERLPRTNAIENGPTTNWTRDAGETHLETIKELQQVGIDKTPWSLSSGDIANTENET